MIIPGPLLMRHNIAQGHTMVHLINAGQIAANTQTKPTNLSCESHPTEDRRQTQAQKEWCPKLGMLNSFFFQIQTSFVKFEFYSNFV